MLDLYADTPPLETLMEVPLHVRRTQLFKVSLKDNEVDVLSISPSLAQMALDICPDDGLMLGMSALSLHCGNLTFINFFDTKLWCFTSPPTWSHSLKESVESVVKYRTCFK